MRAVLYSTVLPAIVGLDAAARSVGIEPVAVIAPRAARDAQAAARRDAILAAAPDGLDVCFAAGKASLERLTRAYEPEIGLCTGYPWLLPPEVLAIPRLGVVNTHPSRLPRLRGPYPFASADSTNVARNHAGNNDGRARKSPGQMAAAWDGLQAPARWREVALPVELSA